MTRLGLEPPSRRPGICWVSLWAWLRGRGSGRRGGTGFRQGAAEASLPQDREWRIPRWPQLSISTAARAAPVLPPPLPPAPPVPAQKLPCPSPEPHACHLHPGPLAPPFGGSGPGCPGLWEARDPGGHSPCTWRQRTVSGGQQKLLRKDPCAKLKGQGRPKSPRPSATPSYPSLP